MRAPGRWIAVALVPAGTIVGHVLGYLTAGEDAALTGTHSHLRPAAFAAGAVAAIALAGLAMVGPGERRRLSLWRLAAVQMVVFALLEVGEHLWAGRSALSCLHDPSFRWGAGAQLLSAALLVAVAALARTSGAFVRELLLRRSTPRRPERRRRSWAHVPTLIRCLGPGSAVSERGPPPGPAPG